MRWPSTCVVLPSGRRMRLRWVNSPWPLHQRVTRNKPRVAHRQRRHHDGVEQADEDELAVALLADVVAQDGRLQIGMMGVTRALCSRGNLEAWVGIEPTNKGFADPRLTTWLPRRLGCSALQYGAAARNQR
jgi:hypothetical protein